MSERVYSSRSSFDSLKTSNSDSSNQLDQVFRDGLEGKYIDDGIELRPPSGTNHQQPGSHLSVDTRLSELNLGSEEFILVDESSSFILSGSSSKGEDCDDSINGRKSSCNKIEVSKPNCYVSAPFKQGQHKSKRGPYKVIDPSYELKEVTREGIEKVRQQFRRPQPPKGQISPYQKLRKARLKTTGRPISGSGPSIRQCKGILAGPRAVIRPNRSAVYFREDLSRIASPTARPDSPKELLRASSSAHCTSVASSETEYTEDCQSNLTDSINNDIIGSWVQEAHFHEDEDPENNVYVSNINGDNNELSDDPLSPNNGIGAPFMEDATVMSRLSHEDFGGSQTQHDADSDKLIKRIPDHGSVDSSDKMKKSGEDDGKNSSGCKPYSSDGEFKDDDDGDDDDDDDKLKFTKRSSDQNFIRPNSNGSHNKCNDGGSQDAKEMPGTGGTNTVTKQYRTGAFSLSGEAVALGSGSCQVKSRGSSSKSVKSDKSWRSESESCVIGNCKGEDGLLMSVHVRKKDVAQWCTEQKDEGPSSDLHRPRSSSAKKDLKIEPCLKGTSVNVGPLRNKLVDRSEKTQPCPDSGKKDPVIHVSPKGKGTDATHFDFAEDCDSVDSGSVDSDCIPPEEIWKNLDTLNLSMSAVDKSVTDHHNFHPKSRQVQSAGINRSDFSNRPKSAKNRHVRSRPVSAKQKERDTWEKPDKGEILRKYLSQEGERFAENLRANLPGYFIEQFNILQGKVTRPSHKNAEKSTSGIGDALEKYKSQNIVTSDDLESREAILEQGRPFPNMEPLGDPSIGVFFTSDTKTNSAYGDVTSGVETMSQLTDVTADYDYCHGDEDAGFEDDIPVNGSPGDVPSEDDLLDGRKHLLKNLYGRSQILGTEEDLEVVATAKQLDTRANQKQSLAPHPPLCFTINAVPPAGQLYYFAYGVDMNMNRLVEAFQNCDVHLFTPRAQASLGNSFGFKLRFNKKGTSRDAGGFPNIEYSPEHSVEGCIYCISDAELAMLDNCVGYPKHYTRAVLPVWMVNCYQPTELGVAQYCVPAVVYVAEQDWVESDYEVELDCSYSLSQCLKAADILTPNYVCYLQQQGGRS